MNMNKFDITPINWIQDESDEQPTGVIVQVSNGDTQYLTLQEYNELINKTKNG